MPPSFATKLTNMGWPGTDALWRYTSLSEPQLSEELARLSFSRSVNNTDCVSFQPCPDPTVANQDRYVVEDWTLSSGTWKFRAVFDGHAGHETVNHARDQLPALVRRNLEIHLIDGVQAGTDFQSIIANVLKRSITSFDNCIGTDLLQLFPTPETLNQLSDQQIRSTINDKGRNSASVSKCMSGATVLLSLLDPTKNNLWVASLGDSQAALGYRTVDGGWKTKLLSSYHNGEDEAEANRVKAEHPGEEECMIDRRVLGAIAVTRAIGDFIFKLPRQYADRVFRNAEPGFNHSARPEEFLKRNLTPPYISNVADVVHVDLASLNACDAHLIMCSDGLMDLYEEQGLYLDEMIPIWSDIIANGRLENSEQNLALLLLRESIGGQDLEKVSRVMTVEMCFRWMDDTTILVQRL
ncbi:hypothetical protein AX17_005738 [Amanita inopinata Kibby_2008]|nr:hypothetical protein AX17_005738 [Amanita inopinata Kibby_2008]